MTPGPAALLLFASGVAALIYQVLWIKQLTLVVGVDVYAVTTGVSAFFAGLAFGGYFFGRKADQVERPLILYSILEIGVAVLGVLATIALAHAARFPTAISFALVGVPAILMGGTLPVLTRSITSQVGQIGSTGGRLYAANTAGAIAGALLTSFLLIPWLGVRRTAFAAAALNLAAAIAAFFLNRVVHSPFSAGTAPLHKNNSRALLLYAIAGGIALGYEVVWSQAIVQFMSTRSFAFSVVLATYLAGLVVGSALYSRFADRIRDTWGAFGFLIAAAGLVALLQIAVLGRWLIIAQTQVEFAVLSATGSHLAGMCARFAVAAGCIVFVPTVLLGAAFPAALQLVVKQVGRDVGAVVALNTIGGIAGTMLAGFILVPAVGLVRSLAILVIAAAVVGVIATRRRVVLAVAAGTIVAAILTPSDRLARLLPGARDGNLVFYEESAGGTVAVVEQKTPNKHFRRLYIQGVSNSGDAMPSVRYMRLQGLLPLIIHNGEPRSALVIGLGTGITAGSLLQFPGLEKRVCAELLPAVVRAAPLFQGNFGAASDPRIEIRLRDGRRELLRSSERYDLITLEPPPPSAAGVVNLYSSDFYKLAASRLQHKGLLAQWLPLPTQNDEDSRSLVRSFLDVFPHASLWTTELHEMLLVGSFEPIELDMPRIATRVNHPDVRAALTEVGISSPAALVATWVTDRAGMEAYAGKVPPVTDDEPRIEYATWVRPGEFSRVLPQLLALRSNPPIKALNEQLAVEIAHESERLFRFYEAGVHAYNGHRQQSLQAFRSVIAEDGKNTYYRWFTGGTP